MQSEYWRAFQRRATRRRVLRGTAIGAASIAGTVALGACGDDDDDDEPSNGGGASPAATSTGGGAAEGARPGGRFQYGSNVEFDTFDPHLSIAASTAFFPKVYNLIAHQSAVDPSFMLFDLSESVEQIDDLTYTFKIRPGVKIAPNDLGAPERDLDANDALVSFQRIQAEPRANAGAFVKQRVASFEAPDRTTFTVRTNEPYAWFFNGIGSFVATVVPRELIEGDLGQLRTRGAGGGAYRLTNFTEGEGATLERNPNYYGKPLPYIDGYDIKVIPDRAARRVAFLDRQTYFYQAENVAEAEDLQNQGDFVLVQEPYFTFYSFTMNAERDPWQDARIRRAAHRSINRQQFADVLQPGNGRPNGIVHWPTGPYALSEDELAELQPHDPDEARRLLEEAGYPDGITIRLMYPSGLEIPNYLPILLEQLQEGGFNIDQDPQDPLTWLDNYRRREYDASLAPNQIYETPQTPLNWHHSKGPQGEGSYAIGLGDPEIDAAVDRVARTLDVEERIEACHEAQRIIYAKDPAYLPLISWNSLYLYWDFVKNNPHERGIGLSYLTQHDAWLDL